MQVQQIPGKWSQSDQRVLYPKKEVFFNEKILRLK